MTTVNVLQVLSSIGGSVMFGAGIGNFVLYSLAARKGDRGAASVIPFTLIVTLIGMVWTLINLIVW